MQAQAGVDELQKRISGLRAKKAALKARETDLKLKIDAIEKRNKESLRIEEKEQKTELESQAHLGTEVAEFLKSLADAAPSPKQSTQQQPPK